MMKLLMGSPRSVLILAIVTLILASAPGLSNGQKNYGCVITLSQSSPTPSLQPNQNSSSIDYTMLLEQQMRSLDGNIDSAKAILLAQSSSQFQAAASGHQVVYNSMFFLFTSSLGTNGEPRAVFESVNVVFSYHEVGSWANIVVTLDPTLTQVTNVIIQPITMTSHPPASVSVATC